MVRLAGADRKSILTLITILYNCGEQKSMHMHSVSESVFVCVCVCVMT